MSQSSANKKAKRRYSRNRNENKSTQTERVRPATPTATINGSVVLKITDFTKVEHDGRSSVDEASMSDQSSLCSANSAMRRHSKPLVSVANCASQTSKERRNSILDTSEAASASDEAENITTSNIISYDYLEGQRLVTSLVDLPLSDSESDPPQSLKEAISKTRN